MKPGMKVAIDEQALGIKATGVVEEVANTPGTRGVDGYHFYLGVKVESTPVSLAGFSVRLTIPIESRRARSPRSRPARYRLPSTERRACWSIAAARWNT